MLDAWGISDYLDEAANATGDDIEIIHPGQIEMGISKDQETIAIKIDGVNFVTTKISSLEDVEIISDSMKGGLVYMYMDPYKGAGDIGRLVYGLCFKSLGRETYCIPLFG